MSANDNKNLMHFNNVIAFNRDEKLLNEIAEEKLEKNDFVGALSAYLDIEELGKFNPVLYRKIADLYMQLNMNGESINYWFKYMNSVTKRHYVDAYNGLGANFLILEQREHAFYYFDMQINDKYDYELPYDDYMYDLFSEIGKVPQLKIVDTQGENDAIKIDQAKELYSKDQEKAVQLLSSIERNSSQYGEAQCIIAAFSLINERYDDAISAYLNCLNIPDFKEYALNNLYPLCLLTKKEQDAQRFFKQISNLQCGDLNHLAKYLLLFDTKDLHQLNYDFIRNIQQLVTFTPDLFYLLGISAYNVKEYDQSKNYFCEYNLIKRNYFSRWCCAMAQMALLNNKKALSRLMYSYYLPQSECKLLENKAEKYIVMPKSSLRRKGKDAFEFADACFCTKRFDLQAASCQVLAIINNSRSEKYLKNLLIRYDVDDGIKSLILSMLVDMGNDKPTGLVFGNVYLKIKFEKVEFNEGNGEIFKLAYSVAFGKLAPIYNDQIYKLKIIAYDYYYKLLANGNLRKVKDAQTLGALFALACDMKLSDDENTLFEYFATNRAKIDKLLSLIEAD